MDKYRFEMFIPAKPKRDTMKFVKVVLSFLAVSVISFVMLGLEIFKNKTYCYLFVGFLTLLTL